MLAMCELDLGSGNVSKSEWDSGFVYMKTVTFFGKLWLAAGEANPVNGVYLARAPVDTEHDRSAGDYMRLVADWEPSISAHEVQVFPPIAHHAQRARASFLTASTSKIVRCVQDDHPRRKGARQKSGVVIVGPGSRNAGDPGDAGSNEGIEAGSDADSHSVHSGHDVEQIDVDLDLGRCPRFGRIKNTKKQNNNKSNRKQVEERARGLGCELRAALRRQPAVQEQRDCLGFCT